VRALRRLLGAVSDEAVTRVGLGPPPPLAVPLHLHFARRSDCLLARAREDSDAFADFYDAYAERVLLFLVRRVLDVDTAFDLVSETFAKALEHRHQFRGRTAQEEQGWLFSIARSELSHFWRDGRVERSALARLGVPVPGLTDPEIERIEQLAGIAALAAELADAMAALPEEQRRAVELRVIEECGYADVAVMLGVSEQTARARVSRGLRTLAQRLRDPHALLEDAA
jgi:RNA polymerase sigma factor (sigma-70 family)